MLTKSQKLDGLESEIEHATNSSPEISRVMKIVIVLLAFFGNFLMASFSLSFNVLLLSIAGSFNVAADDMRLVGSLAVMGIAAGALPCGFLLDRFSVTAVMGWAAALMAGGYAFLALATDPTGFGTIAILMIALPASGVGMASATKLILGLFTLHSGIRFSLAAAGIPAAGISLPILVAWFSEMTSWRWTYGVFSLTLTLFLVSLLLIGRHIPRASVSTRANPGSRGAAKFLLGQRSFWLIVVVTGLASGIGTAIGLTSVGHAISHDVSLLDASMMLSAAALASFLSNPLWGGLFDKFGPVYVLSSALLLCGLAIGIFAYATYYPIMFASFCVFALGLGAVYPADSLLLRRAFGVELLGRAFGLSALVGVPLIGIPTFLVTRLSELGSAMHYLGFAFCYVVLALLLLTMPRSSTMSGPNSDGNVVEVG